MKCGRKYLLLSVVLLLLSSLTLSAETCLTDEEMEELTAIFTRLQTISTEQEAQLTLLQARLETAETSLQASTTEIQSLRVSLSERDKYWLMQMREQKKAAISDGLIVAAVSLVVGFIGGVVAVLL